MVVLRKVNPALLAWNFAINPRKWSRALNGKEMRVVHPDNRIFSIEWDSELIRAVMPEVYRLWLQLRSKYVAWRHFPLDGEQQSFLEFLGGTKVHRDFQDDRAWLEIRIQDEFLNIEDKLLTLDSVNNVLKNIIDYREYHFIFADEPEGLSTEGGDL